ncbi:MAG: hypothetical protein CMH25_01505 [Micavibrio sp.]|nr:hypothetical protein [Micavibrio sp.]|tara:strand:- start:295989 stop:296489 length:501 start_codon:yes stop_codon:yes gene_type:complete
MESFFQDTNNWVLISFIIFAVVSYKLGRRSVLNALDSRIEKIKNDIDTAENLRIEAQELLAQFQRKQREADQEAKRIIETAKEHAKGIQKKASSQMKESASRREKWLDQRLKRMEADAVEHMKSKASELAIAATTQILMQRLDEKSHDALVKKTVKELPDTLKDVA